MLLVEWLHFAWQGPERWQRWHTPGTLNFPSRQLSSARNADPTCGDVTAQVCSSPTRPPCAAAPERHCGKPPASQAHRTPPPAPPGFQATSCAPSQPCDVCKRVPRDLSGPNPWRKIPWLAGPAHGGGRAPPLPESVRRPPQVRTGHRERDATAPAPLIAATTEQPHLWEKRAKRALGADWWRTAYVRRTLPVFALAETSRPLLPFDWLEMANEKILLDAVPINHSEVQQRWTRLGLPWKWRC